MKMSRKNILDPVIHQPIRTRIVAFLSARAEATFKELKEELLITDGNLDAHLKKLAEAGYLKGQKSSGPGRAQTFYQLTAKGEAAFAVYVDSLRELINIPG